MIKNMSTVCEGDEMAKHKYALQESSKSQPKNLVLDTDILAVQEEAYGQPIS